MLTQDERDELLAVERGDFPNDPDLGRVDIRKATILGQAWVKIRRGQQISVGCVNRLSH